jgi:hypothetical protein
MLPKTYDESRRVFQELARNINATMEVVQHDPHSSAQAGLNTDVAYLGNKNASRLIVIASGTHGVEGYGGAACQFHFMRTCASRPWPDDIGFLLVHAVNPWGYFNDRRVTQEGVDLNRNFVEHFPDSASTAYDAFHDRLVSHYRPMPMGILNELQLLRSALSKAGRNAMQTAIVAGQYARADGLFYGGQFPVGSRNTWESIISKYAARRSSVALLDLHTGLGRRGSGGLISYLPENDPEFKKMSAWFKGELKSMQSGQAVTAPVQGTLTEGFDRLVPCQSYAIGLEFGTSNAYAVLNAMRYDHWVHLHANRLSIRHKERAREKMKRAFSVDDPKWHTQITACFDKVVDQLVMGIGNNEI